MTSRVRSHVLEDKSRAALSGVLPDKWVIHEIQKDYGLDVQVELFSDVGGRTGIRFYGQIKATDKNAEEDDLNLDREHIEYWLNHSDPVIIFRYFESSKSFRWCWVHSIAWRLKPSNKTINVSPYLKDWNSESSPKEVEEYLVGKKEALAPLSPPYRVAVSDAGVDVRRAAGVVSELSAALGENDFRFLINPTSQSSFQIYIDLKNVAVSYCGLPGIVFDIDDQSNIDEYFSASLLGIVMCSQRYGRTEICRLILSKTYPTLHNATRKSNGLKSFLFSVLIHSVGLECAVAMTDASIKSNDDPSFYLTLFIMAAAKLSSLERDREFYIKMLTEWRRNPLLASSKAMLSYNLGNAQFHQGRWEEARDAYLEALLTEPFYGDRVYFWEELGAAHFESGNFGETVKCYQRAISLGASLDVHWKIGEAFFNLGKYENALNSILIALKERPVDLSNAYESLLQIVCKELIDDWGLKVQKLVTLELDEVESLKNATLPMSKEGYMDLLRPLMQKNAIDPWFSFNAGITASRFKFFEIALFRFLVCALRQRGDAEAWVNTLICAFNANSLALMPLIAVVAKFYCGDNFLRELDKTVKSIAWPDGATTKFSDAILDMLSKIDDAVPDKKKDVTLRIWSWEAPGVPPQVFEIPGSKGV